MSVWYLAGVVGFICAVLLTRLNIAVSYSSSLKVTLQVLFIRRILYPKPDKPPSKKRKTLQKHSDEPHKKKFTPWLMDMLDIPHIEEPGNPIGMIVLLKNMIRSMIKLLGRHVRIRADCIDIVVATGDAASTAMLYGLASQALSGLMVVMCSRVNFKAKKVGISTDYTSEKSRVALELVFSLRVWQAAELLMSLAMDYVKRTSNNTNNPENKHLKAGG